MSEEAITEWFAGIYAQSEATIAVVLDMMRKNGETLGDYVIVVADTTGEETRFFVDQLLERPLAADVPGYVGALPKSDVARVLRLMAAESYADDAEKPLEDGWMRLLVTARGRVQCADLPAMPLMAPGGRA